MAASRRLGFRAATGCWGLCVYAWVPSQEDLHRLWRADELQAGPKIKKNLRLRGRRPDAVLPTLSTYFYILSYADPSPPRPPVLGVLVACGAAYAWISIPHTSGECQR